MRHIAFMALFIMSSANAFDWKIKKHPDADIQIRSKNYTDNKSIIPREFQGYIEYTTEFQTPANIENLALYLGKIGDADKVYVNNILVGQTGDFPPNFQYGMDIERNYIIPYSILYKDKSNNIKVHVYSKYFVNKGLKTEQVKIGDIAGLNHLKYTNEIKDNVSRVVIPLLCLILAAISFPFFAPKALWCDQTIIFLLGLSSFILGLCRGRICFHYFEMLFTYKANIISSVTTLWLISYYSIGSNTKHRKIAMAVLSLIALGFAFSIVLQQDLLGAADVARYWFHVAPFFILMGIIFYYQKRSRNYLLEAGLLILFFADINDVLHDLKLINSVAMLQSGLGAFILLLILNQVIRLRKSWESYFKKELELDRDAILGRQAVQLAHDIRSPLEALKSAKDEIASLPELERESINLAIRRIEEIAFNLLQMRKGRVKSTSLTHVKSTVTQIIQEKKLQFRDSPNLNIYVSDDGSSYDLFSGMNPETFKRILSNILDNAAEAINFNGAIRVCINSNETTFSVTVIDKGPFLTKDKLNKVFEKGFTTKPDGNGLGLYHAKKEIEQSLGTMSFSQNNETEVKITLPKHAPPKTFAVNIDLKNYSHIIILDDDESIHQVWKKRFKGLSVSLIHYYKASDLLEAHSVLPDHTLLLSDYELLGESITGIDCISRLQAFENSLLITARADEQSIIKACKDKGIKILPKSMANEIDIIGKKTLKNVVLIDDDKLTHFSWKIAAKNSGISFSSFFSVQDFLINSSKYPLDSTIYIDSDLGQNLRGELLSKNIFDLGFTDLYIATGFSKEDINKPSWIKEIFGKKPPF